MDQPFVEDWTLGYDEFTDYVKDFTPETVSGIMGIPAAAIEELAREIADAEGTSYVMYTGRPPGYGYLEKDIGNQKPGRLKKPTSGQSPIEACSATIPYGIKRSHAV